MEWYGYTGKTLKIDLTEEKISILQEKEEDIRHFIGGMGMNTLLGARHLKPRIDPFSTENPIILGTGPLVGTIMPGASRTLGLTKFPATGAIANSCGSMSFGFNLKQAGYDHIILTGKSPHPVYLLILDDHVELKTANNLWGKDIIETTNSMWKKYNDCGVISIGQAGENQVAGALTLIDKTSTFGRGGLGAVFGSKNLKAITVKGTKGVLIAYPKEFSVLYKNLMRRIRNYPHRSSWIELGMLRSLPVNMFLSARGEKKKARQCNDKTYLNKLKRRRIACPSCPMADKDILEIKEGEYAGLVNYTSSIINPLMMMTISAINRYDEAVKIFDLISRYGLDSLTITALYEFIGTMHKKQLITNEDLGFEWNDELKTLINLIDSIAKREGFGEILANGWHGLSNYRELIKDEMLTIKGLDVVFEPRFLRLGTMEFEQVVNPKGAHVASGGSPTYLGSGSSPENMKRHFNRMGIPDSAFDRIFTPPIEEMGINVGRLTRYSEDWYTILSSVGLCARAQMNRFFSLDLVTQFYNTVTGFDFDKEDIRVASIRTWNLLKLLNIKEGFSRDDDKFPTNWFKPLKYGEIQLQFKDFFGETLITQQIANQLLDDYYEEREWNKQDGKPMLNTLKKLNLENYL